MKILVIKKSKDGLAEVSFSKVVRDATADQATAIGNTLLLAAGNVIDARFKEMKRKEKAKADRARR